MNQKTDFLNEACQLSFIFILFLSFCCLFVAFLCFIFQELHRISEHPYLLCVSVQQLFNCFLGPGSSQISLRALESFVKVPCVLNYVNFL